MKLTLFSSEVATRAREVTWEDDSGQRLCSGVESVVDWWGSREAREVVRCLCQASVGNPEVCVGAANADIFASP